MQVQPNSTIYLLEDVPIDKSYNYSLHFERIQDQTAYFQSKVIHVGATSMIFSPHQYQRATANSLKVAVLADDVITCNYIMFKNDGVLNNNHRYKNKWFYAFATVRYLNENACTIEYEIDDIQTWMFDYEFNECFVEREHSASDIVGDNLQPEPIDVGELVAASRYEMSYGTNDNNGIHREFMFGAIITNKPLNPDDDDEHIYIKGDNPLQPFPFSFEVSPTFSSVKYEPSSIYYQQDTSSGISNGLYIYTGLLVDFMDWFNFFHNHISLYNMYNPLGTSPSTIPSKYDAPVLTLGSLINAIVHGSIANSSFGDLDFSENNIVACYQYPAGFNRKSAEQAARSNPNYFKKGIALFNSSIGDGTSFNPYGSTYTPKNNKLKTAPFAKLLVTTETGSNGEYRYEYFGKVNNNPVATFNRLSTYFAQPTAICAPTNYKGKAVDYDDAVMSSPYPQPIYAGDAFQAWWQDNKYSFVLGTITNALSLGLAGAMSFSAVNDKGKHTGIGAGIGNVIHGAGAIGGSIGTAVDKSNVPPNSYYQAQNEALSTGTSRLKFVAYSMCVTPEYARKIDSFFTKYGYATNELKIPNLQRGEPKRHYWNYLKVKNCMLHGLIPSDVEDHLERIYENGITMWTVYNNQVDVGDYSKTNDIVVPL